MPSWNWCPGDPEGQPQMEAPKGITSSLVPRNWMGLRVPEPTSPTGSGTLRGLHTPGIWAFRVTSRVGDGGY